jgi:hypothetical protein
MPSTAARILFLNLLLSFLYCPARAGSSVINDPGAALSVQELRQLQQRLDVLQERSGVEVHIFLLKDLPQGRFIEDQVASAKATLALPERAVIYAADLDQVRQDLWISTYLEFRWPSGALPGITAHLLPFLQQKAAYAALDVFITDLYINTGLLEKEKPAPAGESFEQQERHYSALGDKAVWCLLAGAGIFCIWAALYKKRYREQFTINGRYVGIGSKYYHDHYEADHYDPDNRYGRHGYRVRPEDDPWCYQESLNREARLRELRRREKEARKGGGASTTW